MAEKILNFRTVYKCIYVIGIGSTPSCSQPISASSNGNEHLTEIHPGNYAFYDLQQLLLGSCREEDIAARVLTRILGQFPGKRNQFIIDAGFTALSQQGFEALGGTYAKIKVRNRVKYPELIFFWKKNPEDF